MRKPKPTLLSIVITQAIAVIGFVIVPAVVTFVAPRSTVEMRQVGEGTSAKVIKYILLVVPFREIMIDSVVRVESHVTAAKRGYSTHSDRLRGRKVDMASDGSIQIIGRDSECQVQSTAEEVPDQAERLQAFIENPTAEPLVMTLTAGWALTYLLGGVMTGLSALYCAGAVLALGRWLLNCVLPARDSRLAGSDA